MKQLCICEVIKLNESFVWNISIEKQPRTDQQGWFKHFCVCKFRWENIFNFILATFDKKCVKMSIERKCAEVFSINPIFLVSFFVVKCGINMGLKNKAKVILCSNGLYKQNLIGLTNISFCLITSHFRTILNNRLIYVAGGGGVN